MAPDQPLQRTFFQRHSLSLASTTILVLWIVLYIFSSPSTHLGSFFGNAIADWSGVLVTVLATKWMYEKGSAQSRKPKDKGLGSIHKFMRDHSLTIFLVITGIGWIMLYISVDSESKWGQVTGNIVSEWTQIFGLVLLTKKLVERHSKEGSK